MLKKVALFLATASVILIVAGVLAFPPTRWKKTEGDTVRSYERSWRLLRRAEWGVTPTGFGRYYPIGSYDVNERRFGFIALTEIHEARHPERDLHAPTTPLYTVKP
nr:hypothetical protein [Armatimonas sp.]